jgi:hypothetical protein
MNLFWVFVPGIVILTGGLLVFEWRNRRQQLMKAASLPEKTGGEQSNK